MLWFHNHVGGAGGVLRIVSTTNGGQERKFIGGSQEISNRLALKQGLGCKILHLESTCFLFPFHNLPSILSTLLIVVEIMFLVFLHSQFLCSTCLTRPSSTTIIPGRHRMHTSHSKRKEIQGQYQLVLTLTHETLLKMNKKLCSLNVVVIFRVITSSWQSLVPCKVGSSTILHFHHFVTSFYRGWRWDASLKCTCSTKLTSGDQKVMPD